MLAVRLARGQGVPDAQPEVERQPSLGIAELVAADLLDAAQPVRHRVAVQVQARGRLGKAVVGSENASRVGSSSERFVRSYWSIDDSVSS